MTGSLARVLCVDDDAEALDRLRSLLVARGYEVCTARNLIEATAVAKRWTPGVAIVSPCMPSGGGREVLEHLGRLNPGMTALPLEKPLDLARVERSLAAAGVHPARPRPVPRPRSRTESSASRIRVLVVDDEADVREVLAEYLRGRAFEVALAATGEEALAVLALVRPDLILLDLALPGLDGIETLRRIRAGAARAAVVVISANEATEVGQLTLALGAAGYVPKPVDFDYLDAVLEAFVQTRENSPRAP